MPATLEQFSFNSCCCTIDPVGTQTIVIAAGTMDSSDGPSIPPDMVLGQDFKKEDTFMTDMTDMTEAPKDAVDPAEQSCVAISNMEASLAEDIGCKSPSLCPLECMDTFSAVIENRLGGALGLELSPSDGACARVARIFAGAVQVWNWKADERNRIREGDLVLEVNGVRGDAEAILKKFEDDTVLSVLIKRRPEFIVTVFKGQSALGLDVQCTKIREGLRVNNIKAGPVMEWNKANPNLQVEEGDRIVEINGFQGEPKDLLQALKDASELEMRIVASPHRSRGALDCSSAPL